MPLCRKKQQNRMQIHVFSDAIGHRPNYRTVA